MEEVWAACVECLTLLCYDHFIEDVACRDHGKVNLVVRDIARGTEKRQESTNYSENLDDFSSNYDSDADPEFNLGVCEIEKCKQGIWTAWEECDMLLCYAHSIEKVNSCDEHGTMKRTKWQKSEQEKEIAQLKWIMEKKNIQEAIERENQEVCREVQELEENRQEESGLEMRTEIAVLNEEQFGQNEEEKPNESIRGRKRTRNEENWARSVKKKA